MSFYPVRQPCKAGVHLTHEKRLTLKSLNYLQRTIQLITNGRIRNQGHSDTEKEMIL